MPLLRELLAYNRDVKSVPAHAKVKNNSTHTHKNPQCTDFGKYIICCLATADLKRVPCNYGRRWNRFPANWKILQMAPLK